MEEQPKESLIEKTRDPLISTLNRLVVISVKILAILMVLVIYLAMIDAMVHLYRQVTTSIASAFSVEKLISTLGAFLAVLIAIEIFLNIIFYLKRDAIHVPLVLATALTAVARKVIILDYNIISPAALMSIAGVIFALGITYWLIVKKT
jgi:uncharacterized membrane protein (DUF373 family)